MRSTTTAWARLHRHAGQWALLGFGLWVVRDRAGAFVGEAGFLELHRAVTPRLTAVEVGWMPAPSAHGKGYAPEAMRAALAWGDVHLRTAPLDRVAADLKQDGPNRLAEPLISGKMLDDMIDSVADVHVVFTCESSCTLLEE